MVCGTRGDFGDLYKILMTASGMPYATDEAAPTPPLRATLSGRVEGGIQGGSEPRGNLARVWFPGAMPIRESIGLTVERCVALLRICEVQSGCGCDPGGQGRRSFLEVLWCTWSMGPGSATRPS